MECPIRPIISTISEPQAPGQNNTAGFALFRSGFRPFFLLGTLFGFIALLYFILLVSGTIKTLPSRWDPISWHRHEMLFGFTAAIIIGFLFTAVPNWTGCPTPKGTKLGLIVLLWLAGRIAVFNSAYLPLALVMVIDSSFFLVCMVVIASALAKSGNRHNYLFILLLTLLALANILTHMGYTDIGIRLALNIIIFIMVSVGGRVIPAFAEKPVISTRDPRLERFAMFATSMALILDVVHINAAVSCVAFLLATIANGWRLLLWRSLKTFHIPLLWVLHAGYTWLVIGMALRTAGYFGLSIPSPIATHAFTAGGIGVLTLGMMARVSLGHSGRLRIVGKPMIFAFCCINLAAICRVFGVWFFPDLTPFFLETASLFWLLAFGTFIWIYTPILIRPRVDGRDG